MQIATLSSGQGQRSFVALLDSDRGRYWPITDLVDGFDGDMVELIRAWESLAPQLQPRGEGYPLTDARLEAPIHPHRNMFCVGKNYYEHATEFSNSGFDSSAQAGEVVPEHPIVFTKAYSTLIADGDEIPRHAGVTSQLDYEAEFAVIIGKGGRGIKKADAFQHVWGYTIANDVTARDLQKKHRQWHLGKSLDGLCPLGPWITTADAIDPGNATIRCWVNGELRQESNTGLLIFDIPTLIETLSAGIELKPGDVILTGTPVGVGIGFDPPRFLDTGDVVRIEVDGMGVLENAVGK
ncbi:fumarylacetoacetate hydrolase family protein [Halomonas sp. C05BenzN]|uniref:fumarylacetoacetate hydrolase family protein n=1 Tax=Halomonas sp. C05BenzN TaxID=3411041 RepID=UPI003B93DCD5